jgi:uncharacterized membrane protein
MQIDQLKVAFTYLIALLVIVGGMAMLYFSRLDPPSSGNLALVTAGFVGVALQFVFQRETATNSARQTERATALGASTQPTTTVSGNPPTTTVTPAEPVPNP